MSRADMPVPLAAALDRFDVPPLSPGFADRVMAAAQAQETGAALPPPAPPRRDRRGMWRRGRQIVIATAAMGMMSCAAVASGLLGAAGIEVPVLTAMLAPNSVKHAKPAPVRPAVRPATKLAEAPKPPAVAEAAPPKTEPAAIVPPWRAEMPTIRAERKAQRQALLERHPGLREALIAGPQARRDYVRQHPEVRQDALQTFGAERAAMQARRQAWVNDPTATPEERQARADFLKAQAMRAGTLREMRRLRIEERLRARDRSEGFGAPAR